MRLRSGHGEDLAVLLGAAGGLRLRSAGEVLLARARRILVEIAAASAAPVPLSAS
jgi:DNA-binding transcriptional LysR family regulator